MATGDTGNKLFLVLKIIIIKTHIIIYVIKFTLQKSIGSLLKTKSNSSKKKEKKKKNRRALFTSHSRQSNDNPMPILNSWSTCLGLKAGMTY